MNTLSNFARKNAVLVFFITIIFLLTISCQKEPVSNLIVSSDTLVFHGNQTLQLRLSIKSAEECEFQIAHAPDWVSIYPTQGVIWQDSHFSLSITSNTEQLQGGTTIDKLIIDSSEGTSTVTLVAYVNENSSFSVPETVTFYGQSQTETMTIQNTGNTPVSYSITSSSSFVEVSPLSGEIPVNGECLVNINIDREALMDAPDSPVLTVVSGEQSENVTINLEKKMILPVNVIDAEYSKATDFIVYIGDDCTLNIYHPSNGTTDVIPLFYIPFCVSISPDGTKAAVGHDAHVSYIDLLTKEVINTGDISCKSYDIVLRNNGWVFVSPYAGSWTEIHNINLSVPNPTEIITSCLVYGNVIARLHPSEKYIYTVDNYDIEKFDIQDGASTFLYSKDRSGRNIWFSENGDRIFTSSRYAYKASESQDIDVSYNGTIQSASGETYSEIQWIDQSEAKKNLYLISKPYSYGDETVTPYVFIHNSDNLIFKNKIELEKYCTVNSNGTQNYFPAQPYYIFSKLDGDVIYVITKAVNAGLVHDWAIQTIKID